MARNRAVERGWMIKSSPHNEDFILAVARRPEDLSSIANQYMLDVGFGDPETVDSRVDLANGVVIARHGSLEDPIETTFYIVQVDIIT